MSQGEEGQGHGEVEVERVGGVRQVILISAGASHSVALLSGNIVCSWGRGEDGQLGHGDAEDRLSPTQLSALVGQEIVSVTCGADHTIALSESQKQVYSWGWGDFGRLGHGNSSDLFIPQPIKALHGLKIRQIACGDSHCLAVTMQGEVQSWGRNQNGQLGLGTTEDSPVPQKIEAFQGISVKMVAAGAEHTAAITEDGELYGWGWGRYGNLGLGDRNDRLVPEKVSAIDEKIILVACGWRHTISVSSSGGLYTYGWSKYGQLGHGDFEDHLIPHRLEAMRDHLISQISGGWRHSMALTSDGKLYGWGWNKFGQVGVGDNLDHCSPVQVTFPHEQKVVQISCGWRHTLAVTEKNNVFSWGRGTNGQLGHKEAIDSHEYENIHVGPKDPEFTLISGFFALTPFLFVSTKCEVDIDKPCSMVAQCSGFRLRNIPTIVEALSADGSSGQEIESSKVDPLSGKLLVSPSDRYAVVPDDNNGQGVPSVKGSTGNGNDASVPQNDVKRIRL